MREADRRTIEEIGIPGRVLMESAGRGVADAMKRALPDLRERSIAIVCGKGNNGGDGLVVFRCLATQGYSAHAYVLSPFQNLSGDARDNLEAALRLGLPVSAVPIDSSWEKVLAEIRAADVVVDAIFGTGLTEPARGLPERVIRDLNDMKEFKVAVDVPSGLSSESSEVPGEAFRADLTVALAAPKPCHLLMPAASFCGELEVADIGIPDVILESTGSQLSTIEPEELKSLLPPRPPDAHKGQFGHLLVVAGSVGKTGAGIMAARAALRSGVGLVTVASAESALPFMAPGVPEAMWEPLSETSDGAISASAAGRALELLAGKSALAMGPGLGRHPETVAFIKRVLGEVDVPVVLDADGINAFQADAEALAGERPLALTPHPGEAGRLLACSARDVQRDRLEAARQLARRCRAGVLLKGHRTLVANAEGDVGINLTGNPGMASGGTGDVLTGMVGAFLARGISIHDALCLAAYLHGLAGDLAAEELGQTSLAATDLITKLPEALRCLGVAP